MGRVLAAIGLVVLIAGGALANSVAETLAEVARRSQDYQESLARLLALQEEGAERAEASAAHYRELLPRGIVSRRDVETVEAAAARALAEAEETRRRMAEAARAAVEAQSLLRLALLPPVPPGQERATPEVVEHAGQRAWSLAQTSELERFFRERFGRPLPVSAVGQTAVHDRLGFDHRNALDIALHPDSLEGRAFLDHLRARAVPFLAFRGPLPGVSTGAHVHVGPPSLRKS